MPGAKATGIFHWQKWGGGALKKSLRLVEGEIIAVFHDTYHSFSCIQSNFITIVIVIFCGTVVRSLLPGDVDAFAVCEKPAVTCRIVALESQITVT